MSARSNVHRKLLPLGLLLSLGSSLGACYRNPRRAYRYVETRETPQQLEVSLAQQLKAQGLSEAARTGEVTKWIGRTLSTADSKMKAGNKGPARPQPPSVFVQVMESDEGSIVELSSNSPRLLKGLSLESSTQSYEPAPMTLGPGSFLFDVNVLGAYVARPGQGEASWRIDPDVRVGHRFLSWGGSEKIPTLRNHFNVQVSPGLAIEESGEVGLRLELLLGFESYSRVQPRPGRRIALSSTFRADLGLGIVAYPGTERRALEGTLAVHLWPWGGVFVRGGREFGDESMNTVSVGVQLDSLGTASLLAGILCGGAMMKLLEDGIDISGPCRHGDPCWDEKEEEY